GEGGDSERQRLPGSGGSSAEDVVAGQRVGDRGRLDGKWGGDAPVFEGGCDRARDAQVEEGGHDVSWPRGLRGGARCTARFDPSHSVQRGDRRPTRTRTAGRRSGGG